MKYSDIADVYPTVIDDEVQIIEFYNEDSQFIGHIRCKITTHQDLENLRQNETGFTDREKIDVLTNCDIDLTNCSFAQANNDSNNLLSIFDDNNNQTTQKKVYVIKTKHPNKLNNRLWFYRYVAVLNGGF